MVSLSGIQDMPGLITDLFVESIDIPVEWRFSGQFSRSAMEHTNTSVSKLLSFIGPRSQTSEYVFFHFNLLAKCSNVKTELKLGGGGCWRVVAYQNKLVFIGGWESGCNHLSSRVDSMDPLTGRVSPITDLIDARQRPTCVATENEIFVFTDFRWNALAVYCGEVYESASERWVLC
ncbi:unnamed protein product [Hymenolepis diminuta]|uniref:Uncharacterized protein n=1 Tax=Hymenolepis diminuta TaxID=6216 RepID=A0A564YC37_HYMDI|nr:unnamed protein product [Hymenolepis diminuta]